MANINLEVSAGQSKTITFQSAGKFTTEDVVFNVTGAAGSTTIATSSGTNQITLSANTKYKLTSAGSTFVFTTPPDHTYNFSGVSFTSTNSTASDKNANNLTGNGTYYYASNGPATSLGASTDDGGLYVQSYSSSWVGQIAQDYRNGRLFVRGKNNGTWSAWKRIANYDEVATSGHNHDSTYLKLSGGTMTGNITVNSGKGIVLTNYTDASAFSDDDRTVPFALYQQPGTIAYTSSDTSKGLTFNAATGALKAGSFVKRGGTSSQFLKADGSVDTNSYSTTSHNHSGVYKPVQTAVSDPTASSTTSTTFIDSISQNANGVITATKKTLPSYASSSHTHATSIATSTGTNQITLEHGGKYSITAGGTSYIFTMPAQYSHPTSAGNKHIPSGGSSGQFLGWSGNGTATWVGNPNTDHSVDQIDFTDSSFWHGIMLSHENIADIDFGNNTLHNLTGEVGFSNKIFLNPSSGAIVSMGGYYDANGNSVSYEGHTHNYAASSHSHGSITSGGAISSGTALANGDAIVFSDSSDSSKLKKSTITFDGSTTTKFLSQKGTWETPSGGGGGSTVVGKTVELSTSNQALITVNGSNSGNVKLPDNCPWMADPANRHSTIGGVIPIFRADTPNIVFNSGVGSFSDIIDVTGVDTKFLFPQVGKSQTLYALPVTMDKHGRLFVLISENLAAKVFTRYDMDPDARALRGKE